MRNQSGMHDLHIFIFALAVFHVLYSVATILLAKAKMKKWESWESETKTLEYQYRNDPSRFRLTHQTSFVKRHSGFSTIPGMRWIVAFFRQFFGSVSKVDYLTMRNGFINVVGALEETYALANLAFLINKRGDNVEEKLKKLDAELSRYKEQIKKTRPGPAQEAIKARAMSFLKQKRMSRNMSF